MGILSGRTAIITGAAQGIGRAISVRYAAEGADVAALDLDGDGAEAVAGELGDGALAVQIDVGDEASVSTAVQHVLGKFGTIDILVNVAAATSRRALVTDLALAEWDQMLRVGLTGTFLMCRAALPTMVEKGKGAIINVASQLGSVAVPLSAPYCASKGGVLQLTRALALDYADKGIRVNSLSPGAVMTPRIAGLYATEAEANAKLAPLHPIGRIGQPEEIAGAAVYLASDDASFMTGADLVIDGGYTAR